MHIILIKEMKIRTIIFTLINKMYQSLDYYFYVVYYREEEIITQLIFAINKYHLHYNNYIQHIKKIFMD